MNITIKEVAKALNKSEQFVRIAIQRGALPIGTAVRKNGKYNYYISPKKLYEYTGIKIKES